MKTAPHRWLLVSLAHPVPSALCVIRGSAISGWLGYATALLAFLANLPGVVLIKPFYQSVPPGLGGKVDSFLVWMIAVRWLLVVVTACYFDFAIFIESSGPIKRRLSPVSL